MGVKPPTYNSMLAIVVIRVGVSKKILTFDHVDKIRNREQIKSH